jgi:protein-tyrosine phosphatase
VSLLEAAEARSLMLANEGGLCAAARIEFLSLPVVDHGVPQSVRPVVRMASEIAFRLAESKNVVVHCFAGIGRSPLMIASVLIDHGLGTEEACALISAARGRTVPEMQSQLQWLKAYERMRLAG